MMPSEAWLSKSVSVYALANLIVESKPTLGPLIWWLYRTSWWQSASNIRAWPPCWQEPASESAQPLRMLPNYFGKNHHSVKRSLIHPTRSVPIQLFRINLIWQATWRDAKPHHATPRQSRFDLVKRRETPVKWSEEPRRSICWPSRWLLSDSIQFSC